MLLLPIGDEPNDPKRVAYMNYALIGMNVAVYLLALSKGAGYEEFVLRWAYNPAHPTAATLFASLFLHAGFLHMAGNMLFLWIFGDNVEARLGPVGYLVSYLALGAIATLAFGMVNAGVDEPVIGASGAVSGVQGMYFVACPRHFVRVFLWVFIIIVTVFKVNARLIMGFWFVMHDVLPLVIGRGPAGSNVAHSAHLGGFVGGLLLMLLMRRFFPGMQAIEDDEFAHASRYRGGRASSKLYEHSRRRNPYVPHVRRKPPPVLPRRPHPPGAPPPPSPDPDDLEP